MKRFAAMALSCIMAVGLCGCRNDSGSGSKQNGDERTITVRLHKSKTEEEGKTYGQLMKKFNESNIVVDGKQVIMDIT